MLDTKKISVHLFLIVNLLTVFSVLILHKDIVNSALISLVVFTSFILITLSEKKYFKFTRIQFIVIGLIFFSAICVLCIQNIVLTNTYDQYGRSALGWSAIAMISNLIWFCWGLVIANSIDIKSRMAPLFYTSILFITICSNIENIFKGVVFSVGNSHGGSETFNHLFVTSNVVILFFYCFSAFKGVGRFFISVVYLFLLFSLQGRAALLGCVITLLIFWIIKSNIYDKIKFVIPLLICTFLIFLYVDLGDFSSHFGSRFSFSGGVGGDTSFYNRIRGMIEGSNWLIEQFFVGDPTIFISQMSGLGSYMHNFISTWQIYGFPFSVVLLVGVLTGVTRIYSIIDLNKSSHVFIFLTLIYSLLQIIVAQSILFKLFWFALGITLFRSEYSYTRIKRSLC